MPSKTSKKTQVIEQAPAPVQVSEPTPAPVVEAKPKRGGNKKAAEQAPVVVPEPTPVEVAPVAPVAEAKPKRTGKKSQEVAPTPTPVEAAPVVEAAPAPVQETKSKRTGKKTQEVAPVPTEVAPVAPVAEPAQEAGSKKTKTRSKKTGKKTGKKERSVKRASKKEEVVAEAEPAVPAQEGQDSEEKRQRFFTYVYVDGEGNVQQNGRYCGRKPKQAAVKGLTKIMKRVKETGGDTSKPVFFGIKECTRRSKHKIYFYNGQRVKLDNPMPVPIGKGEGQKKIIYQFQNDVKKATTEQITELGSKIVEHFNTQRNHEEVAQA